MISRSPRRFLERRGLAETYRKPMSTVNLNALKVRDYPLEPPLPLPDFQRYTQGNPVPDRATSVEWPG
jgi:hypothetical protein